MRARYPTLIMLALMACWALAQDASGTGPEPALATTAGQGDGSETVVVPGDPPLTAGMVARFTGFLGWILDVPLTTEQTQEIGNGVTESWRANSRPDIETALQIVGLYDQIAQLQPEARDLVREQLQPQFLADLRTQREEGSAQWILAIYEAAHNPIAAGNPPLTRQMAEALAEVFVFIAFQVAGLEPISPTREQLDAFTEDLAAQYPQLPPEQQQSLAEMPTMWAALRVAWPALSDEEKSKLIEQWRPLVEHLLPQQGPEEPTTAQPATVTRASPDTTSAAPGASTDTGDPGAMFRLMNQLQMQQQTHQIMSNIMRMQHETTMSIINNIGGGGWRYEYRWVP